MDLTRARVWERVRRYAVPRWMIERATERRLAGDWAGACAAAHVDVGFRLDDVPPAHRRAVTDDLRRLAPDLLRWHLPRNDGASLTTLSAHRVVVLASYGPECLYVLTPRHSLGPQRLELLFGTPPDGRSIEDWSRHRYLWDSGHSGGLLARWGGGRAPFFHADGTPLTGDELPAADPGPGDPVARAEWFALLDERGAFAEAVAAAGLESGQRPGNGLHSGLAPLRWASPDLTVIADEVRAIRAQADVGEIRLPQGSSAAGIYPGPPLDWVTPADSVSVPEAVWRTPPDLLLLRSGLITPERLHPLVRGALFPERPPAGGPVGPPGPELPAPVRVRCRGGEWHQVVLRGGGLDMPHPVEERRRELAVRALGGRSTGCFAALHAWESGRGRLPKALREQRRALLMRFQHGDTPGVLRLMDDAFGPRTLAPGRRTLLHLLHLVDHEELLPRLLDAGLDVNAEDHTGLTPLHVAVAEGGSERYVRALLEAGARTDAVDADRRTVATLIHFARRTDLRFLHEQVRRDHPHLPRHPGEPD